jgi:hypothetical protein
MVIGARRATRLLRQLTIEGLEPTSGLEQLICRLRTIGKSCHVPRGGCRQRASTAGNRDRQGRWVAGALPAFAADIRAGVPDRKSPISRIMRFLFQDYGLAPLRRAALLAGNWFDLRCRGLLFHLYCCTLRLLWLVTAYPWPRCACSRMLNKPRIPETMSFSCLYSQFGYERFVLPNRQIRKIGLRIRTAPKRNLAARGA